MSFDLEDYFDENEEPNFNKIDKEWNAIFNEFTDPSFYVRMMDGEVDIESFEKILSSKELTPNEAKKIMRAASVYSEKSLEFIKFMSISSQNVDFDSLINILWEIEEVPLINDLHEMYCSRENSKISSIGMDGKNNSIEAENEIKRLRYEVEMLDKEKETIINELLEIRDDRILMNDNFNVYKAAEEGDIASTLFMLKNINDVEDLFIEYYDNPLQIAGNKGHLTVSLLIMGWIKKKKENYVEISKYINQENSSHYTALSSSIVGSEKVNNNDLVVFDLLRKGGDVEIFPDDGSIKTPVLNLVVLKSSTRLLDYILSTISEKKGQSKVIEIMNQASQTGRTPLHTAAIEKDKEKCQILLKYGAEFNKTDDNGVNPLTCSILLGDKECAKLFLDYGSKIQKEFIFENGKFKEKNMSIEMKNLINANLRERGE